MKLKNKKNNDQENNSTDEVNKDKNAEKSNAQSTATKSKLNDGAVKGNAGNTKDEKKEKKTKKSAEKNKRIKMKTKITTNHQKMKFRENQVVDLLPKHPLGKLAEIKEVDQRPLEMQIRKKEDNVLIVFQKRIMGILIWIDLCRNQSQRKIVNVAFLIPIMMMRMQQMEYRIKNLRIKSRNKKITVMMNCWKGIMILSVKQLMEEIIGCRAKTELSLN